MSRDRVITLRGNPMIYEDDNVADGQTLKPGHLINYDSSGDIIKHATAAAATKSVALERDEMGDDVDDAYGDGDAVKVGVFGAGMRSTGWIASGENLVKGALLEANGAGGFRALASGVALARIMETIDYRNVSTADTRVKVEWL